MKNYQKKHNRTKKRSPYSGKLIARKNGWIILEIRGSPFERGFAHGALLYKELVRTYEIIKYVLHDNGTTLQKYIRLSNRKIKPNLSKYPEFLEEMRGIVAGAVSKGATQITLDFIIAWNAKMSLFEFTKDASKEFNERCSCFIATGSATKTGEIVMAHNTHTDFFTGQLCNIVQYVYPTSGFSFVMQTYPGYIASISDWFISKSGIMGCESTISMINYKPRFGTPIFMRIRQAMQYGTTIDQYLDIMRENNAGDYASTWFFGDINTNEIVQFEQTLEHESVKRTFDGAYYGINSALDSEIREKDTDDNDRYDIWDSSGARGRRFRRLLFDEFKGKLSSQNAKRILADHYDVALKIDDPNIRSLCKHQEYDSPNLRSANYFSLFGCVDGKTTDSKLARNLEFYGRWGSSCGRVFDADEYVDKYPEHAKIRKYIPTFLNEPWVNIKIDPSG
jgi:hypothetical protein